MPRPGEVVTHLTSDLGEVTVRYPESGDVEALLAFINPISAEQTYIMLQGEQLSFEQERAWLDDRLASMASGDTVFLILDTGSDIVGTGAICRKPLAEDHIGVFGITIARAYRGIGLGKQLMRSTIREAMTHIDGLKLIELSVFANNGLAHRLYIEEGFVEHGRLPGGIRHRGQYLDHILMHRLVE